MTYTEALKAGYENAAGILETEGPDGLTQQDRVNLGVLYVREARKGAINLSPTDLGNARAAFAAHLRTHFGVGSTLKVTIDYQKVLLRDARALAAAPHPVSAVILYATWAEHWMNAQILVSALSLGISPKDGTQMLRDANVPAKLGWLWDLVRLPPIPEPHVSLLARLFQVRNEYLHYKWAGKDPELLANPEPTLTEAIADIERTVTALRAYNISLLEHHIGVAERLMNEPLRAHLVTVYDPEPVEVHEA